MITIEINKKFYSIPQHWDELSKEQLLQVMDALFLKQYEAPQLLLKLLKILTRVSHKKFFNWNVEEVEEYFYLLVFLLKPDFEFTKQLIPEYVHGKVCYYGPADELNNMIMKEFTFSEDYFMQWHNSDKKDIEALNNLVAVLYRQGKNNYDHKRNPEGDPRQAYNQNISEYNAKTVITGWPMNVKLSIANWYDGCRRVKQSKYDNVFNGGDGEASKYGMVSTMMSVAEGKVFGDFEKVEEQYIDLILMHLDECIERAEKLKAEAKATS